MPPRGNRPGMAHPSSIQVVMEDLVKRCTVEERYHEILRTCFARTFGPPPYRLGKSKSGQRRSDQYGTQTQDIRAHEAYTKALTKGPCLFLGFALCVTPRVCRQPRNIQALLEVPSIQLQLDDVTRATFRSWAEYDHYSTANSFTKFIEDVAPRSTNVPPKPTLEVAFEDSALGVVQDYTQQGPKAKEQPAVNTTSMFAKELGRMKYFTFTWMPMDRAPKLVDESRLLHLLMEGIRNSPAWSRDVAEGSAHTKTVVAINNPYLREYGITFHVGEREGNEIRELLKLTPLEDKDRGVLRRL